MGLEISPSKDLFNTHYDNEKIKFYPSLNGALTHDELRH